MNDKEELSHVQNDPVHLSPRVEGISKRSLVEVFSVQMMDTIIPDNLAHVGGYILLKGCEQNYVIYDNPGDKRGPQFNSEGYLSLVGPKRGVQVDNIIFIYPWLFNKMTMLCERSKRKLLWMRDCQMPRTDQVIKKGFRTKFGVLKIDFAVYSDGVEACIEITLLDMEEGLLPLENPSEIYGRVKASNSVVSQSKAWSTLLDNVGSQQSIKLSSRSSGRAEISVSLTRNVIVIPRGSSLIVDVDFSFCGTPQGGSVASGSVTFDSCSRSSCAIEEKIIVGAHAKVKVKAHWST